MRPGPMIRSLFGRYEREVAEAYRKLFIDLDDFARCLKVWVPRPRRILEVGCGEGAMTERLLRAYPCTMVAAIDVTPRVGRLFRGDASRVAFSQRSVDDVVRDEPASFDLIVLCDVLHHVQLLQRHGLLSAIDQAMTEEGSLVFKDWVPSFSPVHWACKMSDRYLTGDDVQFCTATSIKALLMGVFGPDAIRAETTVSPWSNNIAYLIQR